MPLSVGLTHDGSPSEPSGLTRKLPTDPSKPPLDDAAAGAAAVAASAAGAAAASAAPAAPVPAAPAAPPSSAAPPPRSEERRVGTECARQWGRADASYTERIGHA